MFKTKILTETSKTIVDLNLRLENLGQIWKKFGTKRCPGVQGYSQDSTRHQIVCKVHCSEQACLTTPELVACRQDRTCARRVECL